MFQVTSSAQAPSQKVVCSATWLLGLEPILSRFHIVGLLVVTWQRLVHLKKTMQYLIMCLVIQVFKKLVSNEFKCDVVNF